ENRFLVKLGRGEHEEFHWLDITTLNLAFWAGDTLSHTLTITSHVPPAGAPAPPAIVLREIEGERATFCWEPADASVVAGYNVYRATHPTYAYESLGSPVSGTCFTQTASAAHRIYAVTTVDLTGHESGFSRFVWAPRLVHPHAVGLLADGNRVILDPQNGYALLTQRADGRYIRNVGSPHYHLEYSYYLTVDALDRLIISHPGDYYTDRHSVRVADAAGRPILEFGQQGAGDGEFYGPAGVAVWGEPCTYGGPYESDGATLLLLHLDGTVDGEGGETGTAAGTDFAAGRHGLGVVIDGSDTLTYTTAGNLERTEGAVEFWLQPAWDGDDNVSHTFFEVGDGWFNRMRVMKDGANNLRFITWNSVREAGVATHVGDWVAGDWHHVAATWEGSEIALYVDGRQREARTDGAVPDLLADEIMVGASWDSSQQAEAVIDELRISSQARLGNSDTCTYRILVADSGNDRVQVFDAAGNFVSAFGGSGSGPGQFDNPQGLAVDGMGRVIVGDSGNDRLQVLAFDGTTLAAGSIITAGLESPTGVATGPLSRILVADTGHDQIKVLAAGGTVLATYAAPSDGHAGGFSGPRCVVPDNAGNLIVADTGNGRVVMVRGVMLEPGIYLPMVCRRWGRWECVTL
ncbi:MAG: hypothetical protein JXC32_11205, partial [Anaerolineae bacterium]|nr:hypothetical protein [Anaerolineae bacterium]